MPELTGATWRKSSRSNNGGNCVEVADNMPSLVGLRNSKDPTGSALTFSPTTWTAFVAALKTDTLTS